MISAVVIALVLMLAVSRILIEGEYGKLETRDVDQNTSRAVDAVNNRVDQLAIKAVDWAS